MAKNKNLYFVTTDGFAFNMQIIHHFPSGEVKYKNVTKLEAQLLVKEMEQEDLSLIGLQYIR